MNKIKKTSLYIIGITSLVCSFNFTQIKAMQNTKNIENLEKTTENKYKQDKTTNNNQTTQQHSNNEENINKIVENSPESPENDDKDMNKIIENDYEYQENMNSTQTTQQKNNKNISEIIKDNYDYQENINNSQTTQENCDENINKIIENDSDYQEEEKINATTNKIKEKKDKKIFSKTVNKILNSIVKSENLNVKDLETISYNINQRPSNLDYCFYNFTKNLIKIPKLPKEFTKYLKSKLNQWKSDIEKNYYPTTLSSLNEDENYKNHQIFKHILESNLISEIKLCDIKFKLIKTIFSNLNYKNPEKKEKIISTNDSNLNLDPELIIFLENGMNYFDEIYEWKDNKYKITENVSNEISNFKNEVTDDLAKEKVVEFENIINSILNFANNIEKNEEFIKYLFDEVNKSIEKIKKYEEKLNEIEHDADINDIMTGINTIEDKTWFFSGYTENFVQKLLNMLSTKKSLIKFITELNKQKLNPKLNEKIYYNYMKNISNILLDDDNFNKTYTKEFKTNQNNTIASEDETINENNYEIFKKLIEKAEKNKNYGFYNKLGYWINRSIAEELHRLMMNAIIDSIFENNNEYEEIKNLLINEMKDYPIFSLNPSNKNILEISPKIKKVYINFKKKIKQYLEKNYEKIEKIKEKMEDFNLFGLNWKERNKNLNLPETMKERKEKLENDLKTVEDKENELYQIVQFLSLICNKSAKILKSVKENDEDFIRFVFGDNIFKKHFKK